jgi:hypothetical protein
VLHNLQLYLLSESVDLEQVRPIAACVVACVTGKVRGYGWRIGFAIYSVLAAFTRMGIVGFWVLATACLARSSCTWFHG